MELTAKNVEDVLMDCLFEKGADTSTAKLIDGVMMKIGFDPLKLDKHRDDITSMLNELPEPFQSVHGGGGSFLDACITKNEVQWAGDHRAVDILVTLGLAIHKVTFNAPRELWRNLPGGMPYFTVQ